MFLSHSCRLILEFLAFETYFYTYFYIGMAAAVFFGLLCIILIIALAYAYATRTREGASEEDIKSLPKYRFSQSNSLMIIDDNMESHGSDISELLLDPDDSVSTNRISLILTENYSP